MTSLVRTRTVALDSAQLADWARDRASPKLDKRERAARFERGLAERGALVMLSWHHFEELLATESKAAASDAVDLLAALPTVSWLDPMDGNGGLPTIVHLLAAELKAHLERPAASVHEVRDQVLQERLRTGSGATAIANYLTIWPDLQPALWDAAVRRRETFAVTASAIFDHQQMKVRDIRKARVQTSEGIGRQFAALQLALQRDISLNADRRLEGHADVSRSFFEMVREQRLEPTSGEDLLHSVLGLHGVDLSEVDDNTTYAEIASLGLFRKQMEVAAEAAGLAVTDIREVDKRRIPSWLMEEALRKHRQAALERRGSEPNDAHLAGLAAYADVTFVDKRTRETLDQAIRAKSLPRSLLRRYEKNGPYLSALERL